MRSPEMIDLTSSATVMLAAISLRVTPIICLIAISWEDCTLLSAMDMVFTLTTNPSEVLTSTTWSVFVFFLLVSLLT